MFINSCYNNCPNDIRAPAVKNQADSYCRTASLLATTTAAHPKTKTSDSSNSDETSASEASAGNDEATQTGESSGTPTSGGESGETKSSRSGSATAARTTSSKAAAPTMIGNVAGVFMAVAGAAAAALI